MTEPGSPKNPKTPQTPEKAAAADAAAADAAAIDTAATDATPVGTTSGEATNADAVAVDAGPATTTSEPAPQERQPDAKSAPPKSASAPGANSGAARSSGTGKAALVLSALALLGLAGLGYYAWQMHTSGEGQVAQLRQQIDQLNAQLGSEQSARDQALQSLQNEIARLRERPQDKQLVESVNERINNIQQQFAAFAREQNQQLGQMDQRLNGQQQRLQNLSTTSREDWLMAEAEYLLRLANQRVLLERSPANVIALLESADAIMQQVASGMGDPELFAIRRAIAQDLTELRAVEPVDKEGLYLQLQALAGGLNKLPTAPERALSEGSEPAGDDQAQDAEAGEAWYERAWQEVKSMAGVFDQYVRIQDREAPAKPLVDQTALQIARLNLRLAIEQAQVALLREEETIYRQSLARAQELLTDYYQPAPVTREFHQQLKALAQVDIAPELPDISDSLKLLHGYVEELHRTRPKSESGGQSS